MDARIANSSALSVLAQRWWKSGRLSIPTCSSKSKPKPSSERISFMRSAFVALFLLAATASAQTGVYVLKAARLFDGKSDTLVQPGLVVVSGSKIQSVGGEAPANATIIDLGDATLLPGFIDSHTHLTMDFNPDYNGQRLLDLTRPI